MECLTVFERFSYTERRKVIFILLNKFLDSFLVCPSVLPQAPPNGFPDEELCLVCSFQTEREQSLYVCLIFTTQLWMKI